MVQATFLTPPVYGSTDVYLIIGDPVEQVRAPESFNLIFARFGIDAVMVPVRVTAADLAGFVHAAFRAANIKGIWVTIPHKAAVLDLLDDCTPRARSVGAVNAIRREPDGRLYGDLFDGEGFTAGLRLAGIVWQGRRVLVLGAGGAAAAIGASLGGGPHAAALVAFFDPVEGRAMRLAAALQPASRSQVRAVDCNDPAGYDLVVNASPLGLRAGDPMPCDPTRMEQHAVLADILMKNQPTPLVQAARTRGLLAQPGFEMMIQQTHLYLEFFGFAHAAQAVRCDCDFIREHIYPPGLHGEIPVAPRAVP